MSLSIPQLDKSNSVSEIFKNKESLHILVVDDDPIFRKVITELLQKLRHTVQSCEDGQAALQLLQAQVDGKGSENEFDIILLDYYMPGMNGFELLRILKKATTLDIPTIMMSGDKDPDIISKAFDVGVEDFLQKPIRLETLKTRIDMCIEDRFNRIREKELEKQLSAQREKNIEHQRIIATFKTELSEKIDTPIQAVMKTIGDLMKNDDNSSTMQYKGTLIAILKSLGSHDLYKPAFDEIESSTKKWLEQEYTASETPSTLLMKPRGSSVDVKNEKPSRSMENLATWKFDVTKLKDGELIKLITDMADDLGIFTDFKIDMKKWNLFLNEVQGKYNSNDYHNFLHAVDVTQFVYTCLKVEKLNALFSPLEKFAIFLSAICHDIDHPGLNNNYQVNAGTQLAILYNDISVLENHHCALTYKLLRNPDLNILDTLSPEDWSAFRKVFLNCVLATDMTHHFEIQTKFQTRLKTGPMTSDLKDRQQIAQIILKCADISNVSRPFEVSNVMATWIVNEFMNQGDMEKSKSLPVSPLMDRTTMNKAKLQINFIDYIVSPLFKSLTSYLSEMEPLNESIQYNREEWATILEKENKDDNKSTPRTPRNIWIVGDLDVGLLAKIRGFTVLLISDDPSGKAQFANVIQNRGYDVKVASTEKDALSMSQKDPDLIIIQIDLQSCDALNLLKTIKSNGGRTIPIIAIVPMDDTTILSTIANLHLQMVTRPTDISTLIRTIDQGVSDSQENAPCLNVQVGLEQSGDDKDFLIELIDIFIGDVEKQIESMKVLLAEDKIQDLEHVAHSLKGSSGQIAAKPLSRAAFLLEESCKKRDKNTYKKYVDLIDKRFIDFKKNAHSLTKAHTV